MKSRLSRRYIVFFSSLLLHEYLKKSKNAYTKDFLTNERYCILIQIHLLYAILIFPVHGNYKRLRAIDLPPPHPGSKRLRDNKSIKHCVG